MEFKHVGCIEAQQRPPLHAAWCSPEVTGLLGFWESLDPAEGDLLRLGMTDPGYSPELISKPNSYSWVSREPSVDDDLFRHWRVTFRRICDLSLKVHGETK